MKLRKISKNLPGEFADTRRTVQDKLSEYQAYSHGKLRYEFIDPADEEDLKAEAQKNQIFLPRCVLWKMINLKFAKYIWVLPFIIREKVNPSRSFKIHAVWNMTSQKQLRRSQQQV
ncbi:MAG: hypothetical protein B1H06_06220 [Candidatus Cloacimonas sp. 4484_143]|nr:MAG: hypothetical protein B1H06_06220 [Candidatus Cloacimonas sp. 4484_143]